MSKNFEAFWQEVARADEARVKFIMMSLVGFFNRLCQSNPKITDIDQFMGVHNFQKLFLLNLEQQCEFDPEEQLIFRQLAVDTLRKALEDQPAFPQDRQPGSHFEDGKKLLDDLIEAMSKADISDLEREWMAKVKIATLDPAMFPAMLDLIALAYTSNLGYHYCGLEWNIDAGYLLLGFGYMEETDEG